MIHAGIIGATGYAGAELFRLLLCHPEVEISAVSSVSFEGQEIDEIYPNFQAYSKKLCGEDEVIAQSDVVFASLPHGLSEALAEKCVARGVVLIDLGADFRLHDQADYQEWYKLDYQNPALHEKAVYALPELYREQIKTCDILGNPGCYPTSVALGLYPLLKNGLCGEDHIVIDSKSGVTGAGRKMTQNTHYPECNEAFAPYKIGAHRHTPEIEQTLTELSGKKMTVTFVPHLLPVNRGIVSTMYVKNTEGVQLPELQKLYEKTYENEQFVRVRPLGQVANLRYVKYSNFCDVSLHEDAHSGMLVLVSAIDNMVKGAAGQAIQNLNIRFGLPENCGLQLVPPAF